MRETQDCSDAQERSDADMSELATHHDVSRVAPEREARRDRVVGALVPSGIAGLLVMVAWQNGGYDATTRYAITIVVWWILGLGVVLALLPRARLSTPALVALGLGAAYCTWTLVSAFWATSVERVLVEFNRDSMYLGVLALALVSVKAADIRRIGDGLAMGIATVAGIALASRLYPGPFPTRGIPEFLPGTVTRLSFPVGYWNGLAILLAMGVPLLLRGAVSWRSSFARGAAIAPIPVIAAVIYLCSSRGGVAATMVGIVAFLVLAESRWAVVAALGVALAGSAAAIVVLHTRAALVNGPLGTPTAADQGKSAAFLLLGVCILTGVFFALASRALGRRANIPRSLGIATVVVAVAVVAFGVVAAHPVARLNDFKELPAAGAITQEDFVNSHLRNGSGTGRWQYWTVAADAWRSAPARRDRCRRLRGVLGSAQSDRPIRQGCALALCRGARRARNRRPGFARRSARSPRRLWWPSLRTSRGR